MTTAYWWKDHANFGDRLTPLLLERLGGLQVSWAKAAEAQIVACGSVLSHLPRAWPGIVFGTGKESKHRHVDLSHANVLALRGHLTAQDSKAHPGYIFGDPGLLVSQLGIVPTEQHELGVLPHWEDRQLRLRYPKALLIDVHRPPLEVIAQVASCKRLVSSSLHGIITADAFGIPRRWERFPKVQGGGFKFVDHGTVVGPFLPGEWRTADRAKVERATNDLLAIIEAIGASLRVAA